MKVYWGSGGITPRILDLGTRWRWMVSFTPRPLYPPGNSPWYPFDIRLGGPQSPSGYGGEEKNSQPLPGLEPPINQPVAQRYTTELFQLLHFSNLKKFSDIFQIISYRNLVYTKIIALFGLPTPAKSKAMEGWRKSRSPSNDFHKF
jgi:hypothetical protein